MEIELHRLHAPYAAARPSNRRTERRLLASLAELGQLTPIVVVRAGPEADAGYVVIDGYKRMRLLPKLGADTVAATLWDLGELDAVVLERSMRRAESATALEQGWLLAGLQERFGLGLEELARRFDASKSWVSRRLALVRELPRPIQQAVLRGQLGAHAAAKFLVPLARANREDARRLCAAVASLELSNRDIATLYKGYLGADAAGRQLVLERPEVFLRAERERAEGERAGKRPADPASRLLADVTAVGTIARRALDQIRAGVLDRLDARRRREFTGRLAHTRADTDALFTATQEERADAGPEHTPGDPGPA